MCLARTAWSSGQLGARRVPPRGDPALSCGCVRADAGVGKANWRESGEAGRWWRGRMPRHRVRRPRAFPERSPALGDSSRAARVAALHTSTNPSLAADSARVHFRDQTGRSCYPSPRAVSSLGQLRARSIACPVEQRRRSGGNCTNTAFSTPDATGGTGECG